MDRGPQHVARSGGSPRSVRPNHSPPQPPHAIRFPSGDHPIGNAGRDHFRGAIESVRPLIDQDGITDPHGVEALGRRKHARVATLGKRDAALGAGCTRPNPFDEVVKVLGFH